MSEEQKPAAAPATPADTLQAALTSICRDIIRHFEIDAVAIGVVTTDGRIGISAESNAEHADRITKEMHRALMAIAKGDEIVCLGCAGKKTINGYACIGCGGTGVQRPKEGEGNAEDHG